MSQELMETIENGIATLTMNRPDARNALTRDMMNGLLTALPRLAADPAVRVVVLTGAGRVLRGWRCQRVRQTGTRWRGHRRKLRP